MSFAPDWPLETERLVLRPFREDDFDEFFVIQSDVENARWLYGEPRSEAEAREQLTLKRAGAAVDEGGWLSSAVVLAETGALVGDLSLHWASRVHMSGEIGFVMHPDHHGRGYATEASRALLDFAFGTIGLHRVVGRCEPRNIGSARVLEKLGMRLEAHLVENEFVKGEWQSELVYALLAREWQ